MSFFLNIREVKPFRELPPGALKARIRMRLNDWARVYIKYSDGVRVHIIGDDGEFFYVGEELCQGLNSDATCVKQIEDGIDLIAAERHRQKGALGWDAGHDDEHSGGEIARAASCYADIAAGLSAGAPFDDVKGFATDALDVGPHWPWEYESWKPSPDPVRNLEKAGALIAAEIDRLKRKAAFKSEVPPLIARVMEEAATGQPAEGRSETVATALMGAAAAVKKKGGEA